MDTPFKSTNPIFRDKEPFQEDYTPDTILERDEKINEYGRALQDIVDGFGPPNVFVYGQTGVGKTAVTQKMVEFLEAETETVGVDLTIIQINCNKRTTTYQVILYIANQLYPNKSIKQGYHPDSVWELIYEKLDEIGGDVLLILDEIDKLGEDEELLYEFPRARAIGELDDARVGLIGISNNFKFRENLSGRVKSTLCEKEIQFSPYDANELQTILEYYADLTFHDGVLNDEVVPLCAALTAQDTGDARMGLDLLETAGDIARHEDSTTVDEEHVRLARHEIDRANTRNIIEERLTSQMQVALLATTLLVLDPEVDAKTKNIYPSYKSLCDRLDIDTLSESRIRDHLNTLEMFGLLEANEKNLGRKGGRSYVYSTVGEPRTIIETFEEDDRMGSALPPTTEQLLKKYEKTTSSTLQRELDT